MVCSPSPSSTGSRCQLHEHTAGLTVYGHGGLFTVDACDPADDLEEPGGVVVDRDEGIWAGVGGGHEEAGVPQVRHVAFRDRGGGEGVREEGGVGGEGERRMGGGERRHGGGHWTTGWAAATVYVRKTRPGGLPSTRIHNNHSQMSLLHISHGATPVPATRLPANPRLLGSPRSPQTQPPQARRLPPPHHSPDRARKARPHQQGACGRYGGRGDRWLVGRGRRRVRGGARQVSVGAQRGAWLIHRRLPPNAVSVTGTLKIFNTIEEFKDTSAKKRLFDDLVSQVRLGPAPRRRCTMDYMLRKLKQMLESFDTDRPVLNPFLLVTFADLKKYVYHYWFAFPALVSSPAWVMDGEFMPVDVCRVSISRL